MEKWLGRGKEKSGRPVNYIFPQLHYAKVSLRYQKKNDFGHTVDAKLIS
jgi:hypothetical protein